ncbi:orexin receptor type 2 [Plakobranchus ocellatus]|uniref:Orexin receptor type 2 n=1 Tax=Plakobranchus ocellatus TaxID=259542 RepID=A0AAV4CCL9_9GAST|nr:orexin receptor type 2 [Plakobranchus ocellatus]
MAANQLRQASFHGNTTEMTKIVEKAAAAAASAIASAAAELSGKGGEAAASKELYISTDDHDAAAAAAAAAAGGGVDDIYSGHDGFLPDGYSHYEDHQVIMPPSPAHLLIICTILYIAIFVMGLIGNTAVILVVLQCRSMRTSINLLFLNLCLADLFALVITGPTVVVDMLAKENWYLGAFMFLEPLSNSASQSYPRSHTLHHSPIPALTLYISVLSPLSHSTSQS